MKIKLKSDYGTRDPARGFSLAEVLLRYGGLRESWRIEVLAMLRAANPSPLLDLSIEGENRVIEKLLNGEFHAIGFGPNSPLDAPPVEIHRGRWRTLRPYWESSTAQDASGPVSGIVVFPFPASAEILTTTGAPDERPGVPEKRVSLPELKQSVRDYYAESGSSGSGAGLDLYLKKRLAGRHYGRDRARDLIPEKFLRKPGEHGPRRPPEIKSRE